MILPEHIDFLDKLKNEEGVTNLSATTAYLQKVFKVSEAKANSIIHDYLTFQE